MDQFETLGAQSAASPAPWSTMMPGTTTTALSAEIASLRSAVADLWALARWLAHQAFHDPLTGLPNRALFLDRLDQALRSVQRHPEPPAVLFFDLDGFKIINDRLGHLTGDQVLGALATRIRASVRNEDTVARLGGDEFAVLLEQADAGGAGRVADRIAAALGAAIRLDEVEVSVTVSIGIALATPDHRDSTVLLRQADAAMYRAKRAGRGRYAIFDPCLDAAPAERRG